MVRGILICVFVLITTVLVIEAFVQPSYNTDDVLTDDCIRCLCHARTGCYFMKNCASYSIPRTYWIKGGMHTNQNYNPRDPDGYNGCMRDEACIFNTIRGYIQSFPITNQDCNCDGVVTCKDFASIHMHRRGCKTNFGAAELKRFDTCATDRSVPNIKGWELQCAIPDAV